MILWTEVNFSGGSHIKQTILTFLSFSCINMFPRLTACFVFLTLVSIASGAPVESTVITPVMETSECNKENSDFYDQRQNGTENYRIHVNGVVVLVAPAEAVLQAAQLGSLQVGAESESSTLTSQPLKPKPKPPTVTDKIPNSHHGETPVFHPKDIKDKNNLKLLNFLHMFRSIRYDSKEPIHHPNK